MATRDELVVALPNFEEVRTGIDPRGLVTTASYDPSGNRISVVADAGSGHFNATGLFTYDTLGRVLMAMDPLGVVTANAYDAFGDLVSVTADDGPGCGSTHLCQQTALGYDAVGNVISTKDPNGNTTTATFDADRRPLTVTLPRREGFKEIATEQHNFSLLLRSGVFAEPRPQGRI